MIQNKHNFVLGSFVLSGIALIGTSVTILGANALWEDYLIMETYIEESVSGLERGSEVKFRGITIGKVEEITTASKVYDTVKSYAYVRVKVFTSALPVPPGAQHDHTIEDRVNQGLRVSLASANITGGSYLETDYMDAATTPSLEIDWTPTSVYVRDAEEHSRVRRNDVQVCGLDAREGQHDPRQRQARGVSRAPRRGTRAG